MYANIRFPCCPYWEFSEGSLRASLSFLNFLPSELRFLIKKSVTEWEIRDKKERDKKLTEIIVPRYKFIFHKKTWRKWSLRAKN